jgi:SAM-dependent methyltransferase
MFNMGGKFKYGLCNDCGSLNLLTPIEDIKAYYPQGYYSYDFDYKTPKEDPAKLGAAVWLIDSLKLTESSSVLDWGAGSVNLLYSLYKNGVGVDGELHKLRAYDPYAVNNETPEGIKIQDTIPTDITFDVIALFHSIEHVEEPIKELETALGLLKTGGYLVIGTPNVKSMTFVRYLENWVNLDAPRHRVLMTNDTSYIIAEKLGLEVVSIHCDGDKNGLFYSAGYEEGKGFSEIKKIGQKIRDSGDKDGELLEMDVVAGYLNKINYGDTFTAVFKKVK